MWFGKSSLKAAALVLVGAISSMAASGISPLSFGNETTDVNNWNYLASFKLWGSSGIEFGNRPNVHDVEARNKGYKDVDLLSLGYVGTGNGNVTHPGDGGAIDGPIIVNGSFGADKTPTDPLYYLTGPIRMSKTGSMASTVQNALPSGVVICKGDDYSGNCSKDKVPEIRDLRVPTLPANFDWDSKDDIYINDRVERTIDVAQECTTAGVCNLFYKSIHIGSGAALVVSIPKGRIARIFTKKLSMGTQPRIVVRDPVKGLLKPADYEGNLMVYVDNDILFENTDNADLMGTLVSTGTLTLKCNVIFAGQWIANKLVIGNEINAKNFVFKPFIPTPELRILGNNAIYFNETQSGSWEQVNVALTDAAEEKVTFDYCYYFDSEDGVTGKFAGYKDVGAADSKHDFPICNKNQSKSVTIPVGQKNATGIYINPLIDYLVEDNEALWFQINNVKGANLSSDYENGFGYKIYIVSKDDYPTVKAELVVDINEDDKHTFNKTEFQFQPSSTNTSQTFASVIITSLPTVDADSLKLNGVKVVRDQKIAVADLTKLTYKPKADAFGNYQDQVKNKYATFKYKVVGSGSGDNTSKEYTATIKVLPVNDKPSVITNDNNEVVFTVMESGELAGGKAEVKDVSNERNVDTYTYKLVNVTGSDYAVFNQKFELVKDNNSQNMTVKLKSGAKLDYSSKKEYVVYATVKDDAKTEKNAGVTNAGALTSDRFKIVVKIKNVNDEPVIAPQTFEMYEKQSDGSDWPVNTKVGFVEASDPDGDDLTYSISTSGVPFKFKNGTNELVVSDGSALDYETKSTWTFKVIVSDGDLSASANITVKLKDVNEKPIPSDIKEYSIYENSAVDAVVGTFKIFDNDKISGSFETLTLTLSGALTGADSITTKLKNKTLADIFYLKQTAIDDKGYRTISILVKNKSLLDYEALYKQSAENASTGDAKYDVTLTIKDDKSTVTKKTKISVLDVNEPFTATGGTFYLLEHSSGASFVCNQKHKEGVCADGNGKVKAVDEDKRSTTFSKLTYKISTNNTGSNAKDAKNFVVDNQGYIKTASDAEFEYDGVGAQHSYTFLVTVSDVGFTKDVEVTVKLENIDEPPNVVVAKGEVAVREDAHKNDNVDDITDEMLADAGIARKDIERYEIGQVLQDGKPSKIGADIFGIDEDDGRIYINSTKYLDYEELNPNNKFTVQVKIYAPGTNVVINRTLVVIDVNEAPVSRDTVFEGVKESLAGGGSVGVLWATDPDSCSTTPEAACKDALHPHPLKFNKLNFAIVDGADLPFEIDQNSGEITLKEDEELNFNEHEFYKFNVRISDRALDKENPPLSTTVEVIIKIADVNKPSRFEVLSDLYEINENVSKGTELDGDYIIVYDDDADDVDNLKITITGKDGTDAAKLFEVVPQGKTDPATHLTTFAIKTKANLDYEKLYKESKNGALFNVTLKIVDGSDNPTTKETVLRVNDVNEEPKFINLPEDCVDGGYCFEIAENVKEATILGKAEADDPDVYTPKYSTLYFSIENGDAAMFDIDISSGEISTISNVKYDYEKTPVYHFDVVVTDKKHTKTVPVTVTLKNKPEPPVLPDPPPAMNVDENSKKGTTVGVIVATDDDCKGSHKATCAMPLYSLEASDVAANDYKAFTIDNNGTIKVDADNSLNFEVKNEYYVRVVATDGDDPTLSTAVDLTIKINDVNDAPTYEQTEYVFYIHENALKGEFVGSVVADDEDTWSVLEYALSDYDDVGDAGYFKIDSEGKITLKKTVNYETKKQYIVWATATDNGKEYGKTIGRNDFENGQAQTLVTINLINDPDPPEIIDDGKKGYDVDENTIDKNSPTGMEIACYEVKDEDKGQVAKLVPYVTDEGDTDADRLFGAKLKKDGSKYKLCLVVKDGDRLNYEAVKHTHKVHVAVMDSAQLTAFVEKTINIIDVNEMPVISSTPSFSFYENKGANYPIGQIYPSDIDTSKAYTQNVFTAIGGDTDLFTITKDGWIQTKRDFDYEKEKSHSFELEIALSDKDSKKYPKLTTSATISITLKDMPEFPVITSTKFEVEENAEGGTSIGFLEATDPDGDTEFLFSLAQDNPYVTVYSTGEIKVLPGAKIDYEEMQKFTIKVSVKDKDGMSSKKDIVINVIDVNEAPRITPQEFKFPEDSKPGTTKGPVEAKDPDTKNKKFSDLKFYPVEEDKTFDIEPNGDIVLKDELDYESDSIYVVKVYVTDGEFNDTTDITIKVGNVIEKTKVEITRAEAGNSVYLNPDTVYTNVSEILVEWKQNGKTKSSVDPLKEGKNVIIKEYKDPHQDIKGADTLIVFYSTAAPVVDVDAKKTKVEADNIYTIVEGVDKKDSSIYVNKNNKDVRVTVKDTVTGCEFEESFNVDVVLDTVAMPNSVVKTLVDISKAQPSLDKNPSKTTEMPINGDKTKVSYEDVVNGDTVTISYYVDDKGEVIKVPVVGSNGKKKDVAVIEVSTVTVVKGKEVVVSYKADAESGEILYGDSEGNLMVDVPKSSSSKDDEKKVVDLKTGVGAFTVTYDAQGVEGNKATVSYVIDEKGKIVANDEGDRGYLVTYTYTNKFGNSADRSVFMVLDKVAPKVVIMSPKKDAVLYANYVDVDWCIAVDGDMDNCVKQDTLNFQSLNKGVNTIKRVYRDKAGNETVATIDVMMKKAKDVDIDLEKPMIIVSIDSVNKYYADNPPEKDQTYAVSILNPTTQKEKEVLKGFSGETKKGSGEEPYSGYKGHIGPTVKIDMKLPLVSAVGGLATLDDIIINGDMIPLDGVDAKDSKKVTVKEYIEEYCSAEFRESLGKSKDYSKANLYSTKARVTLWFFTTSGQFVDKYRFEQKIDDPDYVDKAGLAKFFFEMKPDLNGELRDANGRLYGTGPFIVKTEVELRSKLRCAVPPITEKSKIGDVLKSTDEMTTRFGYRRPTLRGNERAAESPKKESKKNSKKKSSSDDED